MSKRWIKTTIDAAATCEARLPWERGAKRQAMIAKRLDQETRTPKISLAPLPEGMCISA